MIVINEGDLEFSFGDSWEVLKYDENGSFYKTTLCKQIEGSKAVDFLCLGGNTPLLMLEVKDFSLGVPNQEKFEDVPMIVAAKIRDTLAGIIGGSYFAGKSEKIIFKNSYDKLKRPPRVIYFFEDLATPIRRLPQREAIKKDVILKELKSYLRWLTREVAVVSLDDYQNFIRDLTIRKIS